MATKKDLVSRLDYIKSLIENKGSEYNYTLPAKYNKEDLFILINKAHEKYKTVK